MPELPEVETIRRALEAALPGRRATRVEAAPVKLRRPLDGARLRDALVGRVFAAPRRRGKYLLCDVEGGGSLMLHLGMTGRVQLIGSREPRPAHAHLVVGLDGRDEELRFINPRRFGFAVWLAPGEEARDASLGRLGPEPLEGGFVPELVARVRRRRAPIKNLLLDQGVVAGVGNIYACEALWRALISPRCRGADVSVEGCERLAVAVQGVLRESIAAGGTTLRDHRTLHGDEGAFARWLDVYDREGEACRRCGDAVERGVMGGRATFWCPTCQR